MNISNYNHSNNLGYVLDESMPDEPMASKA